MDEPIETRQIVTKAELLEIIGNGENSRVEFKRDAIQNFDLAKELVAFTNSAGGHVLLDCGRRAGECVPCSVRSGRNEFQHRSIKP